MPERMSGKKTQTGPHFPGSLRDWFAGQALSGRLAGVRWEHTPAMQAWARWCYEQADAMITARDHGLADFIKAGDKALAEAREDKADD